MKKILFILFLIPNIITVGQSIDCYSRDSVWMNIIKMKNLKTNEIFYYANRSEPSTSTNFIKNKELRSAYTRSAPLKFGYDSLLFPTIDSLLIGEKDPIYFTKNIYNKDYQDTVVILNMRQVYINYEFCYQCDFYQRAMFCDDDNIGRVYNSCSKELPPIEHCGSCYFYVIKVLDW